MPGTEAAFTKLKSRFATVSILIMPNPEKQFVVEVDTSDTGVGVVLSHWGSDKKVHPCAFFSCRLSLAERNHAIRDQELLPLKLAIEEWCHLLKRLAFPHLDWPQELARPSILTPDKPAGPSSLITLTLSHPVILPWHQELEARHSIPWSPCHCPAPRDTDHLDVLDRLERALLFPPTSCLCLTRSIRVFWSGPTCPAWPVTLGSGATLPCCVTASCGRLSTRTQRNLSRHVQSVPSDRGPQFSWPSGRRSAPSSRPSRSCHPASTHSQWTDGEAQSRAWEVSPLPGGGVT